jgi:hypothetical protein
MCAVARVDRFTLTHRPSVASLKEAVRESCSPFADNFLNEYSGVKKITQRNRAAADEIIKPPQHPHR